MKFVNTLTALVASLTLLALVSAGWVGMELLWSIKDYMEGFR